MEVIGRVEPGAETERTSGTRSRGRTMSGRLYGSRRYDPMEGEVELRRDDYMEAGDSECRDEYMDIFGRKCLEQIFQQILENNVGTPIWT